MSFLIGEQVRYSDDAEPGTVTALWYEDGVLFAEIDYDYSCFAADLVPHKEQQ